MRAVRGWLCLVVLSGCGRVGFSSARDDISPDANTDADTNVVIDATAVCAFGPWGDAANLTALNTTANDWSPTLSDDVRTTNARTGTFQSIIRFPVGGALLPVARGWGSADVGVGKASFRFVNSHLEAFGLPGLDAEQLRVAQARELLAAQADLASRIGELPMVYVGDYNSRAPDAPAYSLLLAGVGADAWPRTHPGDPGSTCCFDATLTDPADPLTSRIDLVLHSTGVKAARAVIVGDDPVDRTGSGLWPSDHAGVVARLVFPARR